MGWTLSYDEYDAENEKLREALCVLGNGFFALRGAGEETDADPVHYPGTYLAGGYNRLITMIADRPIENEDLVNFPNPLVLKWRQAGGSWFSLDDVEITEFRQNLDLKHGVLERSVEMRDAQGRASRVVSRRFVSMHDCHLAGLEVTLTPLNWSGPIEIESALDGTVINHGVARYRKLNSHHLNYLDSGLLFEEEDICNEHGGSGAVEGVWLRVETTQSRTEMGQAARTRIFAADGRRVTAERERIERDGGAYIAERLRLNAQEGEPLRIEKIIGVFTSRDYAISEAALEARDAVRRVPDFAQVLHDHIRSWGQLWHRCDLHLTERGEGDENGIERTRMILRLHIFHLLQTTSMHTIDMDVGVPARGLHGEAYRGHIFWDEVYIFPFLNLRLPEITRALLHYRYRRLNQARAWARANGFRGAMYPWQSSSNGREETQQVHLNPKSGRWLPDNSSLQRHSNAAIALNIWSYVEASDDYDFLSFYGAEMFLEIARFFASLATFNEGKGRYELLKVMGPDEFHDAYPDREEPGLDNNAYTNVMVVWILRTAEEILDRLNEEKRAELSDSIGLEPQEVERWQDIRRRMFVPFHADEQGEIVISQFEGYENLQEFDWEGYRAKYTDIQRLDRILEAEGDSANRYKASKQADVVMLFYLFSRDELQNLFAEMGYEYDEGMAHRNVAYYEKRTSHGSTLSNIVHAWVMARLDRTQSWTLFKKALESDVSDIQGGTTHEGIHLGAMAGTVDLAQRAYTGMELSHGTLRFNPQLPDALERLEMRLRYRRHRLNVTVDRQRLVIAGVHGMESPVKVALGDDVRELCMGEEVIFDLNTTELADWPADRPLEA